MDVKEKRQKLDVQEVAISVCFWMRETDADLECALRNKIGQAFRFSV